MGRCCFEKITLFVFFLMGLTPLVEARCLLADKYRQSGRQELEVFALNLCAVQHNDDDSQIELARRYMSGEKGVKQSETEALYMYQLSAENGNAEAQVKLAELLQSFDTSSERRQALKRYQDKLKKTTEAGEGFSGEILHPYTLLLLASERVENKWYYPSLTRAAPARASTLLGQYKISPQGRQQAMQDASRWKTRKLLEAAKEVVSPAVYPEMEQRLKNSATRSQAMEELKQYLTGYVTQKQKERSGT